MKSKLRIFWTNWINVAGIFMIVYLFVIIDELARSKSLEDATITLYKSISSGLIGMILYGSIFFAGFLLIMLVLDMLLISEDHKNLRLKLFLEWVVVSSPFLYWFYIYSQWIFVVAVFAFLITQLIREKIILRLTPT